MLSKPTPKSCARTGDGLDQQVDQAADHEQGQANIHQYPPHHPNSQARLFQAMAHDGLVVFALAQSFEHTEILGV